MKPARGLTPEQHALGRLIAADPDACAALNRVASIVREIRARIAREANA